MAESIRRSRRTQPQWLAAAAAVRTQVSSLVRASQSRHERLEVTRRMFRDEEAVAAKILADEVEVDAGERLPAVVRERLRSRVGPAADAMRIHHDETSHRVADAHDADAVASGADVYFRRGRYQPHDEAGFALLAHEATHVSRSIQPNTAWRPMLPEVQADEAAAIALERDVRRRVAFDFGRAAAAPSPEFPVERRAIAPASPTPRPMTAAADRPLDTAPPPAPIDMERLRQTLARDLIRQIKAELERGG